MSAIGTLMLEVVDKVADVAVADSATVSFAMMLEDLSLKDGVGLVVCLGTEHLEGQVFVLIIVPCAWLAPDQTKERRLTHGFDRSFTSHTVE
jgi:hypothetical protein